NHALALAEEVLIVDVPLRGKRQNQRRSAASSRASAALRVVSRCGRHVAEMDAVEVSDVDTKLHRRRTEQGGQLSLAETLLTVDAVVDVDLTRVFTSQHAAQIARTNSIELAEVLVWFPGPHLPAQVQRARPHSIRRWCHSRAGQPANRTREYTDAAFRATPRDDVEYVTAKVLHDRANELLAFLSREVVVDVPRPFGAQVPPDRRARRHSGVTPSTFRLVRIDSR